MRNDDGVGMTVALYSGAAAAAAAAPQITDIWEGLAGVMGEPIEVQTFGTVRKLAG
jgi:hypothetical protein